MSLRKAFDYKYASVVVPTFFALAVGFWWTALSVRDDVFYLSAFGFLTLTLLWFVFSIWGSDLPTLGSRTRVPCRHWKGLTLALLLSAVALFGWAEISYGEWLSWMTIRTHYVNDEIVGWVGKRWLAERRIDIAMNRYHQYLAGQLGLDLPKDIPVIRFDPQDMIAGGISKPGDTVALVYMPARVADTPPLFLSEYSIFTFNELVGLRNNDGISGQYKGASAWIYACYFHSSYSRRNECPNLGIPNQNWIDALWDMRTRFGQRYTDALLASTLKGQYATSSNQPTFDAYFIVKLAKGLSSMPHDKDYDYWICEVLAKHNIPILDPLDCGGHLDRFRAGGPQKR